jgi:hypothetical protein
MHHQQTIARDLLRDRLLFDQGTQNMKRRQGEKLDSGYFDRSNQIAVDRNSVISARGTQDMIDRQETLISSGYQDVSNQIAVNRDEALANARTQRERAQQIRESSARLRTDLDLMNNFAVMESREGGNRNLVLNWLESDERAEFPLTGRLASNYQDAIDRIKLFRNTHPRLYSQIRAERRLSGTLDNIKQSYDTINEIKENFTVANSVVSGQSNRRNRNAQERYDNARQSILEWEKTLAIYKQMEVNIRDDDGAVENTTIKKIWDDLYNKNPLFRSVNRHERFTMFIKLLNHILE